MGELVTLGNRRVRDMVLDQASYVGVDNLLPNFRGRIDSTYLANSSGAIEFDVGDVLIGNIRPYLKKIWHSDRRGGASPDVLVLTANEKGRQQLNSRFLYHLVANDKFVAFSVRNSKGAKMPRGDKRATLRYEIPVPPLEDQAKIVALLDQFDQLVNGLEYGLPAEIAARRQQYEYYRNRLLTFDEISA